MERKPITKQTNDSPKHQVNLEISFVIASDRNVVGLLLATADIAKSLMRTYFKLLGIKIQFLTGGAMTDSSKTPNEPTQFDRNCDRLIHVISGNRDRVAASILRISIFEEIASIGWIYPPIGLDFYTATLTTVPKAPKLPKSGDK